MSGTSMAAPHVSGMAAIIIEDFRKNNKEITPHLIKSFLMDTAERVSGVDNKIKSGVATLKELVGE